jgi:N-acyl-D-aspartate/D-glutamate deacylase
MYRLGDPPDYEPDPSTSLAAIAARQGVRPDALAYDVLLENGGRGQLLVTAANYSYGNLDSTLELLKRDDTVLALGDGGAHYGALCDASYPTTHLTHWVRDRKGERLDVAHAVRMLTDEPARLYGFRDRGRLEVGLKGDVNVIDMERLRLHAPSVVRDLPAGGRRLMQTADGYVATIVAGVVTKREGVDTPARPGRLVRHAGLN